MAATDAYDQSSRHLQAVERLKAFWQEAKDAAPRGWKPADSPTVVEILALPPSEQAAVVVSGVMYPSKAATVDAHKVLVKELLTRKPDFTPDDIAMLAKCMVFYPDKKDRLDWLKVIGEYLETRSLPDAARESLEVLKQRIPAMYDVTGPQRSKLAEKVDALLGEAQAFYFSAKDEWAKAAQADLEQMPPADQQAWIKLLTHAQTATASKPTAKWQKTAASLMESLPSGDFAERVTVWFPLFNNYRMPNVETRDYGNPVPDVLDESILKGLIWSTAAVESPDVTRAVGGVGVSAFKKLPEYGARAVKIGNAAIWALGHMPTSEAVGQLAYLKVKVKGAAPQKQIDKALTAAAERLGVPREDVEEMGVPMYGLTGVGVLEEQLGDYTARLTITGPSKTELLWVKPDGKRQKSVPATVKRDHAEELKEIKAADKDIKKMLPAQRDRIDNLYLQQKSWPLDVWWERYLDHPLVGTVARRIIWRFTSGEIASDGCWLDGHLVDHHDEPLTLDDDVTVRLWHPIDAAADDVLAWRDWLMRHEVRQPFKQAHREVYLLTDAERQTEVYSNRFAAHVLRQQQLNALCGVRGWRYHLAGGWDGGEPNAWKEIATYELQASYWLEAAYEAALNDAGFYLYVLTDQVRFAPQGEAEPMRLEDVPPIVFSEVMRDVDLFVGVTSVGNDPTWQDGGPDGYFRDYWQTYSFGDLTATAKTRRDVLQRLIPRLRIADRCSFDEKFLIVRGDIRTYKIHLGSGNILMEPNDQYLCIVPDASLNRGADKAYLPFEGDRTLSIVLSKALLLADDTKIKDATIVSQIRA